MKILNAIISDDNWVVGGLRYKLIESSGDLDLIKLQKIDVAVFKSEFSSLQLLRTLRSVKDASIAFKPVMLMGEYRNELLTLNTDGFFDPTQKNAAPNIAEILSRVNLLSTELFSLSEQESLVLNFCRYIFTRNIPLTPKTSRSSNIGYTYPYLGLFVDGEHNSDVFKLLTLAENRGLLTRLQLIDRLHLCFNCGGSYLNFRESCAKCNSLNLKNEDVVHHFSCAHVGPVSTYQQNTELICPKCDRLLRHIGVDYDKPSQIYTCNQCGSQFQQARMKAYCFDCHFDNDLLNLRHQNVYEYNLSQTGINIAKHGISSYSVNTEKDEVDDIDIDLFTHLLRKEVALVQRGSRKSYVIKVHLSNAALPEMNPAKQKDFNKEIVGIISEYITDADTCIAISTYTYLILLTEPQKQDETFQIITHNIKKLLYDNFLIEQSAVKSILEEVSETTTVKTLVDNL